MLRYKHRKIGYIWPKNASILYKINLDEYLQIQFRNI